MLACPSCRSEAVIKNGHIHNGKQRLRCKDCGRQFVPEAVWRKVSDETKALIDRLLLERLSLAGIVRATGVSATWVKRYAGRRFRAAPDPAATAPEKKGSVC